MPFTIKRAVDIHRGVPVGIDFKMTHRASEQLAPFDLDAFAALVGEPLPFRAASGAILAGAMWIHLDSDCALNIGFVFGVAVDLAAQLIGLAAVHPPRFACACGLDLAQPLKEQHTAGILGADVGNAARDLVSSIFVHPPHMSPQLLIAVLALHRLARLPLFFRNTLEMPEASLIESVITDKDRFNDPLILAHRDHGELLDIEIHRHGHQVRICFALFDLFGRNFFDLREVQGGTLFAQDEFGALGFPGRITPPRFKVPAQFDGIVVPLPLGSRVDLEPGEAGVPPLVQVGPIQIQTARFVIERGMIPGGRRARLPFFAPEAVQFARFDRYERALPRASLMTERR